MYIISKEEFDNANNLPSVLKVVQSKSGNKYIRIIDLLQFIEDSEQRYTMLDIANCSDPRGFIAEKLRDQWIELKEELRSAYKRK